MARTSAAAVKLLLMDDYGPREDGSLPDLAPFIDTASLLVDRVATCATAKGKTLSTTELELVERWLAAHCYAMADQPYSSRSTQGASGSFQGQTGMALDGTKYGQTAQMVDVSGCLAALGKRQAASMAWLGKVPSEQIDYLDRD